MFSPIPCHGENCFSHLVKSSSWQELFPSPIPCGDNSGENHWPQVIAAVRIISHNSLLQHSLTWEESLATIPCPGKIVSTNSLSQQEIVSPQFPTMARKGFAPILCCSKKRFHLFTTVAFCGEKTFCPNSLLNQKNVLVKRKYTV